MKERVKNQSFHSFSDIWNSFKLFGSTNMHFGILNRTYEILLLFNQRIFKVDKSLNKFGIQ